MESKLPCVFLRGVDIFKIRDPGLRGGGKIGWKEKWESGETRPDSGDGR